MDAEDETVLSITWEPVEGGSCREMIQFTVDNVYRLTAVLFGKAEEPTKPKKVVCFTDEPKGFWRKYILIV